MEGLFSTNSATGNQTGLTHYAPVRVCGIVILAPRRCRLAPK
jgi:hypothetical protein